MHCSGLSLCAGVGVMGLAGFLGGGLCPNLGLGLGGLLTYFPGLLSISWMVEQGFIQSKNDPCLYHKPAKLERVKLAQIDKIQQLVAKGYMQSN